MEITLLTFLQVSSILFFATAFRTAFGFGEALIAVPLLSFLLPVKVAAPVAVLASILIALIAVIREREHIHISSASRLLIATALGLPFGLMLLRFASESLVKAFLGVLLLTFSLFSLFKPGLFVLKNDRLIWLFGFLAGVMGGSYGVNGPPLVIFGTARGWSPQQFRATIQAYFFPASLLGMVGYYLSGLWTSEVNIWFSYSLPAIFLGIFFGVVLTRTMDHARFARFLYAGLILVSVILLIQAF